MERTVLIPNTNISCAGMNVLSLSSGQNSTISISDNADILITEICDNASLEINIKEGANARLSILSKNNIDGLNINANIEKDGEIAIYFADFSLLKEKVKVQINLNGERAKAVWHLASLSANFDNKEFDVSIYHNAPNTIGLSDNYGVCKDEGKLIFSGISKIFNGSIKSKTNQNAKIMVFDKASNAVAKPILKIDENDIEASHAAIVGKINDEHLFYLTSRGLTESEAKQLITYGYLKPIVNGFSDEEVINEIGTLIEGRM